MNADGGETLRGDDLETLFMRCILEKLLFSSIQADDFIQSTGGINKQLLNATCHL